MKGKERRFSVIGRRYVSLCSCPQGRAGRVVLLIMDIVHRPFASWVISAVPHAMSFLDIGSGSGYIAGRLLRRREKPCVTLLDISPLAISCSMRRLSRYGNRAVSVSGSADDLPFPSSTFQAAIMMDSIYYMDISRAFSEAFRVIVPGGSLVVAFEAMDPDSAPSCLSGIAAIRSPEEIRYALEKAGFHIARSDCGRRSWARIVAAKPMC